MRGAAAIAGLELRRRARDRSLLILGIGAPLLLAAIISAAFRSGVDDFSATVALADEDGTSLSAAVVDGVRGADTGPLDIVVTGSAGEAGDAVEEGDAGAAIVIPAGFAAALLEETPPTLTVMTDPARALVGSIAEGVAQGIAARVDTASVAVRAAAAAGAVPSGSLVEAAAAAEPPIAVDDDFGGPGGELDLGGYFGPAMAILFMFFAIGGTARSILEERQAGTLVRVRAAPIGSGAILAGKSLAVLALGSLCIAVLWGATTVLLGADWGEPAAVAALSAATVVAVAGVAALVAALARTDAQAESFTTMVAFTLALLGGNFLGPGDQPEVLERLAVLTPNGWALRGFAELSIDGSGIGAVAGPLAVLVAMGATCAVVAALRFRRVVAE